MHVQDDTSTLYVQTNVQDIVGDDTVDNEKVTDSGEVDENPPVTNVESEKEVEEVRDEKGKDVEEGREREGWRKG